MQGKCFLEGILSYHEEEYQIADDYTNIAAYEYNVGKENSDTAELDIVERIKGNDPQNFTLIEVKQT